ncbi:MAG: cupin domain-containing protein [Planctomycetaceae bacterium]|nr:cupin domain-containing protein [Planctomycetaceae bacterium]
MIMRKTKYAKRVMAVNNGSGRSKPVSVLVFAVIAALLVCSGQQRPVPVPPKPKIPAEPAPKTEKSETPEFTPFFRLPEDIPFPKGNANNPKTITLAGNPLAEGLYVTRTLIPKGKQIIPHSHRDSRTVVVLSGTYYYGIGEEFDEKRLVALPPGSFFVEPAGVPHFTWAKNEDVIVQTTAIGPSGTQIVPAKTAPKAAPPKNNGK